MPYASLRQRRYIFAKAGEGVPWARKFIADSGETPPPHRLKTKGRSHHRRRVR